MGAEDACLGPRHQGSVPEILLGSRRSKGQPGHRIDSVETRLNLPLLHYLNSSSFSSARQRPRVQLSWQNKEAQPTMPNIPTAFFFVTVADECSRGQLAVRISPGLVYRFATCERWSYGYAITAERDTRLSLPS